MPDSALERDLKACVESWRQRHGLREDDAVLLLVELFRIHQHHWDALRQSIGLDPRSSDRKDEATSEPKAPETATPTPPPPGVHPMVALLAIAMAAAGGFLLGKGWL